MGTSHERGSPLLAWFASSLTDMDGRLGGFHGSASVDNPLGVHRGGVQCESFPLLSSSMIDSADE